MKLQQIIQLYLNGESFSLRKVRDIDFQDFQDSILTFTKEDVFLSFETSYQAVYGKCNRLNHTIPAPSVFAIKSNTPRAIREFTAYTRKNFKATEVVGVYVHGSIGDGTYIEGSSDFDALVVLKKQVLTNYKSMKKIKQKIVKLNTFLYLFDPLQHHNLFVFSEYDLENYFEACFPIVLFNYAKEITTFQNPLHFNIIDSLENNIKIFKTWVDIFSLPNKYFCLNNSFSGKHLVQSILFLPIVYLQAKTNNFKFKKFVYDIAKEDFTDEEWKIIERATYIRDNCLFQSRWPYWFRKLIGLGLHYKYLHYLHVHFDRNISKEIAGIVQTNWESEIKVLTKAMTQNINESRNER